MADDANLKTISRIFYLEFRWVGAHQGNTFETS